MKKFALTLIIMTAFLVFAQRAYAVEDEQYGAITPEMQEQSQNLESSLPDEARDIVGEINLTDLTSGQKGLDALMDSIKENGLGIFKISVKSGVMILTIVLLTALATSAMSEGGAKDTVSLCGVIAVSAVAIDNMSSFIGLGISTLNTLSDFSKAILPTLCAAAVSAGAFTSAAAKYAATAMFMDILISIGTKIIMPLITGYMAAIISGAALGKDTLTRVADMLKWICTTALTLLTMAFTAYLSITGLVSGKADEVTARMTKTALGTLLPVVGETISSAAETLVAGAGIVRNTIGIVGLLAVAAVCLIPVLKLGAHYLVYKGTAALSETLTDKRMAELISGVGTAFGMVLALVGVAGAMLFISIYSSMKAVGAL